MLDREPRLRTIVQINMRFLYAAILLFFGWTCWQWTSPEWWGLGVAAGITVLGGVIQLFQTVQQIVAIFARERKIDAYAGQGGKARGDSLAQEAELRKRGLIR